MKFQPTFLIPVLFTILMLPSAGSFGQKNTLQGQVVLSVSTQKKKISRGNSYRNRVKGDQSSNLIESKADHFDRVVISLTPLNFKPETNPLESVRINQKEKSFSPQILPVTVGTSVQFVNQDDFYHNVFSLTPKSRFNIGRRPAGAVNAVKIKKLGIINVFCDIHPQMKATIVSLETPYFSPVTSTGKYLINDLPDGKYQIEIYVSESKINSQEIEIKNGETRILDLIVDENATAFVDHKSSRLLVDLNCCKVGVTCYHSEP